MSTFSETNLPPIVRLGGTTDALIRLGGDTLYAVAPGYVRRASVVQTSDVSIRTKSMRIEDLVETEPLPAEPGQKKPQKRRQISGC